MNPTSPHPALPASHRLVWEDDFRSPSVNPDNWVYRTDSKLWSTQTADNVDISDGQLRLQYRKERKNGMDYTGGGLISRRAFGYGFFEARLRMPAGMGWHTSFWLMTHDGSGSTNTDTTAMEIDICEQDSILPESYYVSVHRWKGEHLCKSERIHTENLSLAFHRFACLHEPGRVVFYADERVMHEVDTTDMFSEVAHMHIWLTGIACNLSDTPRVDDNALPSEARFDWVRVYQPKMST
ncbi:MAG: glycoside hydrolase family 16 protein [Verrucomicrobia bacterium]|nr:glycoside hydrolase family 16 protein [Verrucomicrobiota bacterium]MCH8511923.1 glycoside hydrolase family 16 protein [Kiritimatiellia bacterium]